MRAKKVKRKLHSTLVFALEKFMVKNLTTPLNKQDLVFFCNNDDDLEISKQSKTGSHL